MAPNPLDHRLIELLVAGRVLGVDAVERLTAAAAQSGLPFSAAATRLGAVTEHEMADGFARLMGVELVRRAGFPPAPMAVSGVNLEFLRSRKAVIVGVEDDALALAMANPGDEATARGIEFAARRRVVRQVAFESEVDEFYQQGLADSAPATSAQGAAPPQAARITEDDLARLSDQSSEAPVIRLVNRLILNAAEQGASDIHLEPTSSGLAVRFRIDGLLQQVESLSPRWVEPIASRVKLMSRLDIAEKRLPQDGRMQFSVRGRPLDLRVATFPTLHGESIVLRLLGQGATNLDLDAAGLSASGLRDLRRALAQPHGIVLLTGPTGSGKTTTLYAALKAIRRPELKIVTVEDPIEYTVPGVAQLQVQPEIGLSYPAALRSILRNDPDVIMIGEIRDRETADIAIRASLTGHLVLATLHTNTAAGAVTRLLDLGVEDFLLASTLSLSAAQRLVRRLCPDCCRPRPAEPAEQRLFVDAGLAAAGVAMLQDPVGCDRCRGRGFRGRSALFEAILVGEDERARIRAWRDEKHFGRQSPGASQDTLWHHGLSKVLAGETTLEEVMQVVECPQS